MGELLVDPLNLTTLKQVATAHGTVRIIVRSIHYSPFTNHQLPFTISFVGDFYPEKISERFSSPNYAGMIKEASAKGKGASFVCGVSINFSLKINGETKEIIEAKFKTNGCGYVIAAADMIAERINGQMLTDLHGLEDLAILAREELGPVHESREHCIDICFYALGNALAEYRQGLVEEWTGEKALICTCFGVSEEKVENLASKEGIKTVESIGDNCSAGTGCGSCQPLIQEILDAHDSNF
ncbi:MAG: hypothetical protein HKN25_03950 [Pyrinomonadaceae bacterium]|nr:hypothetical protein [Pyrinomonadaceae bacterium]